jgi:hypothetical protein
MYKFIKYLVHFSDIVPRYYCSTLKKFDYIFRPNNQELPRKPKSKSKHKILRYHFHRISKALEIYGDADTTENGVCLIRYIQFPFSLGQGKIN